MPPRIFPFLLASVLGSGALATARNLVLFEPGKSPNYWCTWSAQSYMQGQGAKDNDPILYQVASIDKYAALQLNEENLFGANGWLRNFYPKVRGDLWVVLDDGWDLPVNRDLGCYFPEADVSLNIGRITGNIGIFGYFKSLTLVLDKPLGEFRIWAQDLAGDGAVNITSKVLVDGNRLVFPGDLIKTIGLSAASPGDLSDPAMVVEIVRRL